MALAKLYQKQGMERYPFIVILLQFYFNSLPSTLSYHEDKKYPTFLVLSTQLCRPQDQLRDLPQWKLKQDRSEVLYILRRSSSSLNWSFVVVLLTLAQLYYPTILPIVILPTIKSQTRVLIKTNLLKEILQSLKILAESSKKHVFFK